MSKASSKGRDSVELGVGEEPVRDRGILMRWLRKRGTVDGKEGKLSAYAKRVAGGLSPDSLVYLPAKRPDDRIGPSPALWEGFLSGEIYRVLKQGPCRGTDSPQDIAERSGAKNVQE